MHDSAINSFFLLDQLEYQDADEGSALAWDASGWVGAISIGCGSAPKANGPTG